MARATARTPNTGFDPPPTMPADDEFFRTPQAASFLKVSESKLEKDRLNGKGPRFYRLPNSRAILYRKADLVAFVNQGAHGSTSERAA